MTKLLATMVAGLFMHAPCQYSGRHACQYKIRPQWLQMCTDRLSLQCMNSSQCYRIVLFCTALGVHSVTQSGCAMVPVAASQEYSPMPVDLTSKQELPSMRKSRVSRSSITRRLKRSCDETPQAIQIIAYCVWQRRSCLRSKKCAPEVNNRLMSQQ